MWGRQSSRQAGFLAGFVSCGATVRENRGLSQAAATVLSSSKSLFRRGRTVPKIFP
jgi:hypothetical protein